MKCLIHRSETACKKCEIDLPVLEEKIHECRSCEYMVGNHCEKMAPYTELDLMIKSGIACPVGRFAGGMPSGGQVHPARMAQLKPTEPPRKKPPAQDIAVTEPHLRLQDAKPRKTDLTPRPLPPSTERTFKNRFGSALEHVIPNWLPKSEGCKCNEWKVMLDKWGHKECVKRRARILAKLMEASEDLPALLRSVPKSIREKTANRYLDKAYKLSDPSK